LIKTIVTAVCFAYISVPAISFASETEQGFFATVHGGISSNRLSTEPVTDVEVDRNDSAYAVLAGYRWGSALNYGVEAGYVDLGHSSAAVLKGPLMGQFGLKAQGYTVGGNLVYDFNSSPWFVALHGGWFHASNELTAALPNGVGGTLEEDADRWYAGLRVGYKISEHVRFGLAYDNYNNLLKVPNAGLEEEFNTEMYSGFYEYTF
jgi:hypothetical protein